MMGKCGGGHLAQQVMGVVDSQIDETKRVFSMA
jgi:hypothetical protein